MLHRLAAEVRLAVRFALDSSLAHSAPAGARGLRLITYPRVVLGGLLARAYHRVGVPFEWTPLFSLPFLLASAYFLYEGALGLGVLLAGAHVLNDAADGLAMGWAIDGRTEADKPRGRMRLRRFLDTYVVDVTARFALYLVFILRLHAGGLVPPLLLVLLGLVEISNATAAAAAEIRRRRLEFHYDFVLPPELGRRLLGRGYGLQVLVGQLCAYHNYALYPLLGYLLPLRVWGPALFAVLLAARLGALAARLTAMRTEAQLPETAPEAAGR